MMIKTTLLYFIIANFLFAQTEIDTTQIFKFFYNNQKYEIVKLKMNWETAANFADERGGILAEINNREEQDTIFYYLNNSGIDIENTIAPDGGSKPYVWIGGNDLTEEGKWIWDGNNDNYGKQFWQGTFSNGFEVDSLYNNWGNEPDNFSNQDGLAICLTNWPRGIAGEWNDIITANNLYFVIEYDNSTLKIKQASYNYDIEKIEVYTDISLSDSFSVQINDSTFIRNHLLNKTDSSITFQYSSIKSEIIKIRVFKYYQEIISVSKEHEVEILKFGETVNSYVTDFEDLPASDFLGSNFSIEMPFPFRNNSIHSIHNYNNSQNITYTLLKRIVIDENAYMKFSEVVVVEPADEGAFFGEPNFNDYVIVEGSKKLGEWKNLIPGYNSGANEDWKNIWENGGLLRNYYKPREINLKDTFNEGDSILIRFRLFSNEETNGWGWCIDSLQIQDVLLSTIENEIEIKEFHLSQNYPNPFNPTTNIEFNIPRSGFVELNIYNVLGELLQKIISKQMNHGNHSINFNGKNLECGIYFYELKFETFSLTKKMILLK